MREARLIWLQVSEPFGGREQGSLSRQIIIIIICSSQGIEIWFVYGLYQYQVTSCIDEREVINALYTVKF